MYRIYLADDNDLFRESLEQTIAWEEMSCVLAGSARDGETAEREILALRPDIVLLDIRMPGVSGLEIAAELSRREMNTRVIIVSGYSDFGYTQKSIRLGVFDYLLKPVDERELRDVIARAIADLEAKRGKESACTAGGRWCVRTRNRTERKQCPAPVCAGRKRGSRGTVESCHDGQAVFCAV